MVNINSKLRKQLVNISRKYNLKVLILFGSRAKSQENQNSDWDFAFYPQRTFTVDENMDLFDDLITLLNDEKVDLIDLESSKKLHVINEVFQTGVLVFEKREGLFKNMKWNAWIDYQDFKHYYEKEFEITKRSLQEMTM